VAYFSGFLLASLVTGLAVFCAAAGAEDGDVWGVAGVCAAPEDVVGVVGPDVPPVEDGFAGD